MQSISVQSNEIESGLTGTELGSTDELNMELTVIELQMNSEWTLQLVYVESGLI